MAKKPRGRPFVPGDPRRSPGGRPKKTVNWKAAEDALREAIPRILLMEKNALRQLLEANPTGVEMLAAKYLHEYAPKAVERFLGKMAIPLTGADGAPLIPTPPPQPLLPPIDFTGWSPAQIDKFIETTGKFVKTNQSGAAVGQPPALPPPAAPAKPA